MPEITWISEELAIAIHQRQLAEHGGMVGVRDAGLLSSALSRPKHLVTFSSETPSLTRLAAAYAFGIAKNHPFLDGNKRTAYVVCRTFLLLNGSDIEATQEEKYRTILNLAEGNLSEEELAEWLDKHLRS